MDEFNRQQGEYDYWLYLHCGKLDKEGRVTEQEYEYYRDYAKNHGRSFYEDRCSFSATIWNEELRSNAMICGKKFSVSASSVSN